MKYPDDFKFFDGKALSSNEIDELLQEALMGGSRQLATGDTMIEIDDDKSIIVWQWRADREG